MYVLYTKICMIKYLEFQRHPSRSLNHATDISAYMFRMTVTRSFRTIV